MRSYTIRQGDSVDSIAFRHGLRWDSLWDHPANRELRERRGDPDVLLPGDALQIPVPATKRIAGATGRTHRFVRRGLPAWLRLTIETHNEPRGDERYVVDVDGVARTGVLDALGRLDLPISPTAATAKLTIGDDPPIVVELGALDPLSEPVGVQARLRNLGFYDGPIDGEHGELTTAALVAFQRANGLPESGEPDAATRAALATAHEDEVGA